MALAVREHQAGRLDRAEQIYHPDAGYESQQAESGVVLDPLYFGGGFTTYHAFSLNKPVVTLPTRFQRGRYTLGCYRKMRLSDCVASDADDYVEIALRLGTDEDYRAAVVEQIRESAEVLFEDVQAVEEYERIFEQLVGEGQSG